MQLNRSFPRLVAALLAASSVSFPQAGEAVSIGNAVIERQGLSAAEQSYLQSRTSGIVPWRHVHHWFREGRFEAVARAFEGVVDPEHWLRVYGETLASTGREADFGAYLARYHNGMWAAFDEGVRAQHAVREALAAHREIRSLTAAVWSELERDVLDADADPQVRVSAFARVAELAGDAELRAWSSAILSDPAAHHGFPVADKFISIVYRSGRSWVPAFASRWVQEEQLGWQAFLDASWRHRERVSDAWVTSLSDECSERVLAHVSRTLQRPTPAHTTPRAR